MQGTDSDVAKALPFPRLTTSLWPFNFTKTAIQENLFLDIMNFSHVSSSKDQECQVLEQPQHL